MTGFVRTNVLLIITVVIWIKKADTQDVNETTAAPMAGDTMVEKKVVDENAIIDIPEVGETSDFTITCDIKKFNEDDRPTDKYIYSLSVERMTSGADYYKTMVRFLPAHPTRTKKITKPLNSIWSVQFIGNEGTKAPSATMKIVIDVQKASYRDAGKYRCFYHSVVFRPQYSNAFILRPKGQENIVNKNEFKLGSNFTVQCNLDKFAKEDQPLTSSVTALFAEKRAFDERYFEFLAIFQPLEKDSRKKYQAYLPARRKWDIVFNGYEINDENTGKALTLIYVLGAQSSDAGVYRCGYKNAQSSTILSEEFNLTVTQPRARRFVTPKPPFANKHFLELKDELFVQCSVDEILDDDMPLRFHIVGLIMQRKFLLNDTYDNMAAFLPNQSTNGTFLSFRPNGAIWNVNFTSYPTNDPRNRTLVINVYMHNASCEDIALYRCGTKIINDTEYKFSTDLDIQGSDKNSFQPIAEFPQASKKIVGAVDPFYVMCAATEILECKFDFGMHILEMVIQRRRKDESSFMNLAVYDPADPPDQINNPIPEGRDWEANLQVIKGSHKRNNTLLFKLQFNDGRCSDSATFRCGVRLTDQQYHVYSEPITILEKGVDTRQPTVNPPFLSKEYLGIQNDFFVRCKATDEQADNMTAENQLIWLALQRKAESDSEYTDLAVFDPGNTTEFQKLSYIPEGRKWDVEFLGGGGNSSQFSQITINIKDGGCSDIALYRCATRYNNDCRNVYTEPSTHSNQGRNPPKANRPVSTRTEVKKSEGFIITCSYTDVFEENVPVVNRIEMKMEREAIPDQSYVLVALYDTANSTNVKDLTPHGRNWNISFDSTINTPRNITYSIKVNLKDGTCIDAGQYRCGVKLLNDCEYDYSEPLNITTKETFSHDEIEVSPYYEIADLTSELSDEDNAILTCTYEGEKGLNNFWETCSNLNISANIFDDESLRIRDALGCHTTYYRSTMSFKLSSGMSGWTYFCDVYNGRTLVSTAQYTIVVKAKLHFSRSTGAISQHKRSLSEILVCLLVTIKTLRLLNCGSCL
ncbi:hypothetical protein Bpfe_008482 [Biomphalaria pfeifferi]|uniref:Ig-like domain-containing protein n=1 Tax=Biomphalaria pfeifferi TaxID=112525 RepID=A0AAD8BY60_BIOPF|nr:hypothetical protein Bpfe_008482 [Biomphalaria pfeifferi]